MPHHFFDCSIFQVPVTRVRKDQAANVNDAIEIDFHVDHIDALNVRYLS